MPLAQMMVARSSMKTLSPMPRATSWYKKWWVWALVGGGVAVVGTTTVLLLRRRSARTVVGVGQSVGSISFSVIPGSKKKAQREFQKKVVEFLRGEITEQALLVAHKAAVEEATASAGKYSKYGRTR